MKRRVCYVSGTRADFGLMARALRLLAASPKIELGIIATGMHLSDKYGLTVNEIDLPIIGRAPSAVDETTGAAMAQAVGETVLGVTRLMAQWKPHLVLLLGDRGEMLAGAIAATYLGMPIAHVHGGERSGTVDEPVRHAISKLSHFHIVATEASRERLVRMGERSEHVFVTGAPGLDELGAVKLESRSARCARAGLDAKKPMCLVVVHPEREASAADDARAVMEGVLGAAQVIAMMPNADAGGDRIRTVLEEYGRRPDVRLHVHLPRAEYLSWLAAADAMVGNSSSGIIEAASLGQWVINVGSRQRLRERNANVVDVPAEAGAVRAALADVLGRPRGRWQNVYGDGRAAERIVELIERVDLGVPEKVNAY